MAVDKKFSSTKISAIIFMIIYIFVIDEFWSLFSKSRLYCFALFLFDHVDVVYIDIKCLECLKLR